MFAAHLKRWNLQADGDPIVTHSSHLLPVRHQGEAAMLKVAHAAEERRGPLMQWWDGDGTARTLAYEGDALLMERAVGTRSLTALAHGGRDDEASRILCAVATRLHARRTAAPPPDLIALPDWFAALAPAAARHGGILTVAAETARSLFADPQEAIVLHGDIHHGNVLDFGPDISGGGWLAIDPKGLIGERGFDFANIFCNPDAEVATAPGRLARQVGVVAEAARIERSRLLQWIVAYAGLSAAWHLDDGDKESAKLPLTVAQMALRELG